MSDENANVLTMPCGCTRGIVKRMAPVIDEEGRPKIEDGAFVMEEREELQESFCGEHTGVLIERQQAAMRALESGASPNEAIALLNGETLPALTDGKEP